MSFNIQDFKSQLTGGGARPTLFKVQINNPIDNTSDVLAPFMIKASILPSSDIGTISVPYYGRMIKYGGDRVFSPWNVTVINDENFSIRNAMEKWSNSINSHISNTRAFPADYKSHDATITQFGKNGAEIRSYTFQGIFPTAISDIPVAWASMDEIEEFNVTFEYDLWTVGGTTAPANTIT